MKQIPPLSGWGVEGDGSYQRRAAAVVPITVGILDACGPGHRHGCGTPVSMRNGGVPVSCACCCCASSQLAEFSACAILPDLGGLTRPGRACPKQRF